MKARSLSAVGLVCAAAVFAAPAARAQGSLLDAAKGFLGPMGRQAPAEAALTTDELAAGLREALKVGTERVVVRLGRRDGFNADPAVHIPLPPALGRVRDALAIVGMARIADDVELKLNRAAETAAPEAKALFWQAIGKMTLQDVRDIYDGPNDAATRYFRRTMSAPLAEAMRPPVARSLAEVGAVRTYDAMMAEYQAMPFVPDAKANLTDYVVEKALDGLFFYLAREEAAIRDNPAKRTTELLRRVFGGRT